MKHILIVAALLVPGLAAAYPNPNVTVTQSASDLVGSLWTQPVPVPIILADNAQTAPVGQ